jgi:hypothetical protein
MPNIPLAQLQPRIAVNPCRMTGLRRAGVQGFAWLRVAYKLAVFGHLSRPGNLEHAAGYRCAVYRGIFEAVVAAYTCDVSLNLLRSKICEPGTYRGNQHKAHL